MGGGRDKMLQFVTDDPNAKWETADKTAKTKTLIVMSAVNRSMSAFLKQAPRTRLP